MKYIVTINGRNYEVEVEKGEATIVGKSENVDASAGYSTAPAAQPEKSPEPVPVASQQTVAGEAVKAPMPGTILDIKVKRGTAVKRGEVLLILEAMKMENEITAPKDGVVAQIIAVKGASVITGDNLVVIQ